MQRGTTSMERLAAENEELRKALKRVETQLERRASAATRERRRANRMAGTVRAVRAALRGDPVLHLRDAPAPDIETNGDINRLFREVRALDAHGELMERLAQGSSLERAVAKTVRSYLDRHDHVRVRALAQALATDSRTSAAGNVGMALVATQQNLTPLAWAHMMSLPTETWREHLPGEYLAAAFELAPGLAREECERLLAGEHAGLLEDSGWLAIVKSAWGAGEIELATALLEALRRRTEDAPDLDDADHRAYAWLRRWAGKATRSDAPAGVGAGPVIGVLGYGQPDLARTSANLGDHLQTLAALTTLLSSGVAQFSASGDLQVLLARLEQRLAVDLEGPAASVVLVDRDASSTASLVDPTWLLAFGWHMHPSYGKCVDFPYNPSIRPIFISFHVGNPNVLSEDGLAYLRRYSPIGCRDWATVELLLAADVPAFFSGCLTSTLGMLFPPAALPSHSAPDERPVAVVHARLRPNELEPAEAVQVLQSSEEVRHRSTVDNLTVALELLDSYRQDYSRIVTSRLHCALPATALGLDVEFRPRAEGDPRFDGLLGLTAGSSRLDDMRTGLIEKVRVVTERIASGASEDQVYDAWRVACAPAVRQARSRREEKLPPLRPSFDIRNVCETVRAASRHFGPGDGDAHAASVHVALSSDENFVAHLPVVLEGLESRCSRPLHVWVLTRGIEGSALEEIAGRFPSVGFTHMPCDDVDYGTVRRLAHTTISTMDRLLLPELLPGLRRIIYLDIDLAVLADVAELWETDLEDTALAGRSSTAPWAASGFDLVNRSAKRLDADGAADLRRRIYRRFSYDFRVFNAGVLVLDLERMRRDRFCEDFIPFAERFGMHDQAVLNCYAGPNRKALDPAWNAFPSLEPVDGPKIVHWTGPAKPWGSYYVRFRDEWQRLAGHVNGR